jgi:protocatechuate 3,4-dioxygenase beta subunit
MRAFRMFAGPGGSARGKLVQVVAVRRIALILLVLVATVPLGARQQGQPTPSTPPARSLIIGRVVDAATGAPIAGATVRLTAARMPDLRQGNIETYAVLTSDEGEFLFGPITAGGYYLQASMTGYLTSGYGRQRADGANLPLTVGEREVVDPVTIRMWKDIVLTGTVTDEAGEPVVGGLVNVVRRTWSAGHAQWRVVGTPPTDDRGVYRMPHLDPGEYTAVVPAMRVSYPSGFEITAATWPTETQLHTYWSRILPVAASGYASVPQNDVQVAPSGSSLNERVGGFLTQTTQGERSTAPGVTSNGRARTYPTTFAPDVASLGSARVVSLGAGESVTLDVQLHLVPAASVTGTVESPSGSAGGVVVRLQPAEQVDGLGEVGFDAALGVTDAQGRFVLYGVPVGPYVLRASQGAGMGAGGTTPLTASEPIAVGDEGVSNLDVVLRPGVIVAGRVVFEGVPAGAPAPARLTAILTPDASTFYAPPQSVVDASGHFAIPAEPGTYFIGVVGALVPDAHVIAVAAPDRTPWFITSAMVNGHDASTLPVTFTEDVTDVVLTLTDKPAGLAGTVRSPAGAPDADATVVVFPADRARWAVAGQGPRTFQIVHPARTGAYAARDLAPGEYCVVAVSSADLDDPGNPKFLEAAALVADRVTVREGELASQDLRTTQVRR